VETNGKLVWSGRALEERTEKSTAGSPAVYCRTRGFGKLGIERTANFISRCSQADQHGAKSAMGTNQKGIAARSDRDNDCEANDLGSRQEKDRGGTAGALGKVESGEEGCLESTEPAASFAAGFSHFESGEQSLVNGKIAARAPNGFAHLIRNNEFEAIAKSVLVAHGRTNCHRAVGNREAQFHYLACGHFDCQHSCDSGFADVHGTAFQQATSGGTDCDVGLHFESSLPSVVGNRS
jgi:hypothetical protein